MVLQSGVIPYDYSFNVPFQADHKDLAVGISGIVFEQAGFVLADLFNRADLASSLYPDFFRYKSLDVAKIEYTPSGTDTNLASVLDPGLSLVIDQIIEYRIALRRISSRIGTDTQDTKIIRDSFLLDTESNTTQRAIADWLINSHPGRAPNAQAAASDDKFTRLVTGSDPTPGANILNMDVSLLGGSGVLLDIDFGEVIYQPYPYIAGISMATLDNPHDGTRSMHRGVIVRPIYPSFQKSDGSVISINNVEEDGYALNGGLASGGILFRGGNLHPAVTYRVGLDDALTNTFTPNAMSTLPDFVFPKVESASSPTLSGIVLTPTALAVEKYKVGVEYSLASFPNRGIPSGFISVYPRNNYPSGQAYEVFDDAFWLYVIGGHMVMSPLTGRPLHFRRVEYQRDTSSSITVNIWASGQVSPIEVGTNLVTISESTSQDPAFPADANRRLAHFSRYTTGLAFVAEVTTALDFNGVGGADFDDMVTDGTTIYAASDQHITTFDTSFVFIDHFTTGALTLDLPISFFNSKLWHQSGAGLIEIQLTGSGPGSVIEVSPAKTLNVSSVRISTVNGIQLGMDVTGSSTITNGIWLWAVGVDSFSGLQENFMVRVTESSTEFVAQEVVIMENFSELELARSALTPHLDPPLVPNFRRILHLDVD